MAVDLGARTTKAVYVQRADHGCELLRYAMLDAPPAEKAFTPEVLAGHLKAVVEALGGKTKFLTLSLGVCDSMFRPTELPLMPVNDMRLMLKFNSKTHFQQDFPDYSFDCHILPPKTPGETPKPNQKWPVLVGGAKRQLLDDIQSAAKSAGLTPDQVTLGTVSTVNAFELAQPEDYSKGAVALVDIGFKNSTITILRDGELNLNRVVAIGGDRLTTGLAESMGISYAEAEGIKIGMPEEVQSAIVPLLMPLGRELRASIDFFEHQQDYSIGQVFVSGGSARSNLVLEALQAEMMIPCHRWNPLAGIKLKLAEPQVAESEQVAPQLAAAIGAALSTLS